jgi:hypothetical protein
MPIKSDWINDLLNFLMLADELHVEINASGATTRTSTIYNSDWQMVQAKRHLLAILKHLHKSYTPTTASSSESNKERILLLVSFVQGLGHVETLIAEGQYIKACPAIRQDYEFLTRVLELRKGIAKTGVIPNVKNAPEGSQRFYGQLSKIVHPQDPKIFLNFLKNWEGESNSIEVSHLPHFVKPIASHLYMIHVWLIFEFTREAILLYSDVCGQNETLARAVFELERAIPILQSVGIKFHRI